jgi:hypothetical protein
VQGDQSGQEVGASAVAVCGLDRMSDVEELTSVGTVPNINDLTHEVLTKVYENYSFAHHPQNLPIMAYKEKVSKM